MGEMKKSLTAVIIGMIVLATIPLAFILPASASNPTDNDANTGKDAGDIMANATYIVPGNYTGNLTYPTPYVDTVDFYKFIAYNGHRLYVDMTPNADSDYNLELYDPNGNLIPPSNSSTELGMKENYELSAYMDGNWTIRISIGRLGTGRYWFYIAPVNTAPTTPAQPSPVSGNNTGFVYTYYYYTTFSTDIDNDNINYTFYWGDGTYTQVGPYASGVNGSASHRWLRPTTTQPYQVQVRAQDAHGAWTGYSAATAVTIVQNDANSGRDAGPNQGSAVDICNNGMTYYGTLYSSNPIDTQDYYNFSAQQYQYISAYCWVPPSPTDYDMKLYDPNGNLRKTSKNGPGLPENIYFQADITGIWSISIEWIVGEGQYNFYVSVYWGGGGCPYFYVYDGVGYVNEGLLNIHDASGVDVTAKEYLVVTPKAVKGMYQLRLIEHPQTKSDIDQVKLYAMLEDKTLIELPLLWAWHSENGFVLPKLLFSDDRKTTILGADHNNGVSQSIDLKFLALPKGFNVAGFLFIIEGNNPFYKT